MSEFGEVVIMQQVSSIQGRSYAKGCGKWNEEIISNSNHWIIVVVAFCRTTFWKRIPFQQLPTGAAASILQLLFFG